MVAGTYPTKPLGEVLKFKNGKSIKPGTVGEFPAYGSNGLIGGSPEYREEDAIILGRVGAYCGSVAYCPGKFWASDNTIVAYPKDASFDIRFLSYPLHDLNLNRWAGGAAQPLLTQTVLKQIEAPLPQLPEQQKIAVILSAYDDLIENNLRRIKVLEEMAQNLYREWFVKFRFPGHEQSAGEPIGTAKVRLEGASARDGASQQVRMVESPLGKIPEGWEVKPFGELLEHNIGGGWGKEEPDEKHTQPANVIRGTDIPGVKQGQIDSVPFRYHTASNLRSRRLRAGDIVFEVSGGSKDQPVGRALLVNDAILRALGGDTMCASSAS